MTSHGKKQCTGLQQSIQTGAIPTTAISNATFVATTTTTTTNVAFQEVTIFYRFGENFEIRFPVTLRPILAGFFFDN